MTDLTFRDHGSVWLVHPETVDGATWLHENVDPDASWLARALVVEPRYVNDLADGALDAGLSISGRHTISI